MSMDDELSRVFRYATDFYLKRLKLIVIFSIPFIIASVLLFLVAAPTYLALGSVFLRTGSIPELSVLDLVLTGIAYVLAVFIISDTIVNVNIVVRSRRTLTSIKTEVLAALEKYAIRIFYIYTLMLLLLFIVQLLLYENPAQSWLYPLFAFILSFLLFFVPPAVVIDNSDTPTAIRRSVQMAFKNPTQILIWTLVGLISLSGVELFAHTIFPSPFSGYFILLVNSLVVLPYLVVLQTQMYMEKYPLAR
jgi:hypothetical protein